MKISFSGADLFLSYLQGEATLDEVINHEAYKVVFSHGAHYGNGLTKKDIENALKGESTPFYGLKNLNENLPRIKNLIKTIKKNESEWIKDVSKVFSSLLPEEDITNIAVYPIIGYDTGIGLHNTVCMNLNWEPYLNDPNEFLYFIIHECFHVLYEQIHRIPPLKEVRTPGGWLSYFRIFVQNEGYAVYAPLRLREKRNHLNDRDYVVLFEEKRIEEHIKEFLDTLELLEQRKLTFDEYCHYIFGPMRLTYRVGCELVRRIERSYGFEAVKRGIYLDADQFLSTYHHLLTEQSR